MSASLLPIHSPNRIFSAQNSPNISATERSSQVSSKPNYKRYQLLRFILLSLFALPLLSVGCSTSRQNIATTDSNSVIANPSGSIVNKVVATNVIEAEIESKKDAEPNSAIKSNDPSFNNAIQLASSSVQQIESESGITLEAIEQLALSNNPAIKQAIAASAKAGGIRTQVGLKPNPTIGYFGEEIGNEGAGGLHGVFVSQTFVRGNKLALNRRVIDHDVNSLNWEAETQRQRVVTDIRLAFCDALAAQKRLELSRDFSTVAKEGVFASEERFKAKVGMRPDVLQSEIQLNEVNLSIQRAEFDLSAALNELAALAGVPDLGTTKIIGKLNSKLESRDTESEYSRIVANSPKLLSAQTRVDRARANLYRQKLQPVSNITAQLGVGNDDATGNTFANVQLSLPLPIHNKNQGNIRAAHAEFCAATRNVERIQQDIRRELARVMKEYQISKTTVEQYEQTILPKVKETLNLMQQAQVAGEFDFLRVLTVRRAFFDANLRYVTALSDLTKANAKIDGLLLTGGLSNVVNYNTGDDLRGQTLGGQ